MPNNSPLARDPIPLARPAAHSVTHSSVTPLRYHRPAKEPRRETLRQSGGTPDMHPGAAVRPFAAGADS